MLEPLLNQKYNKNQKSFRKLMNKRNSLMISNQDVLRQNYSPSAVPKDRIFQGTQEVSQQVINSISELVYDQNTLITRKQSNISQKKSIRVQFNKKRREQKKTQQNLNLKKARQNRIASNLNRSIYEKFQLEGLRIKSNWQIPAKIKAKSFNSQIMNLEPQIQHFLYYMNLIVNTVFRLSLIAILILMIIYQGQYKLMQMIVIMEVVVTFLYFLAMIKMLYTKKDQESIYLQKNFTDRDITDIQMDRVLRKHFTWRNIMSNVSAYFKLNSKFKNDIKISILRQQIYKRMEIVLCFIPFTVIFFTTPNVFKFQCDYPVQMIVTATICLQFVRITVHYIVIFIEN